MNEKQKKLSGGWLFLALVAALYIASSFFSGGLVRNSLAQFAELIKRIAPVLLFVFALIYCFNLFVNPKVISKYLGSRKGISGWLVSISGGIISMGAIYMWYPLLTDLREKGMNDAFITTFLYNRAVKIQLLPFLMHYFGLTFTIVVTAYMIIFSVINGILVDKLMDL